MSATDNYSAAAKLIYWHGRQPPYGETLKLSDECPECEPRTELQKRSRAEFANIEYSKYSTSYIIRLTQAGDSQVFGA
jgi:hypothetical protein